MIRVLSMDQIELFCNQAKLNGLILTVFTFNCVFKTTYLWKTKLFEIELFCHLTVCKQKTVFILN